MRVLSLLYILHLCRICICIDDALKPGGTEKNGPLPTGNGHIAIESDSSEKPITLDLSNVDLGKVVLSKKEERGIESKEFTPHNGFHFDKVVDGDNVLWTAGAKEHCTHVHGYSLEEFALLFLSVKSDGMDAMQYYIKQSGKWTQVTKDVHDEKMRRDAILARPGAKLDVMDVDKSLFIIQESTDGNVPTKALAPKNGYRLTEVSDGSATIWKAEKDEYGLFTLAHCDSAGGPILATLYFVKADGRTTMQYGMKQDDGTWKWVEKVNYDAALAEMKKDVISSQQKISLDVGGTDAPTVGRMGDRDHSAGWLAEELTKVVTEPTRVILDIANPDETNTVVTVESTDGITCVVCVSKTVVRLESVVDGQEEVWTAKEGERCMLANVLSDDKSTFLAMWVDKANNNDFRYYVKNADGSWHEITKEEYNEKSEGIRNSLKDFRERKFGVLDLINPNSSNIDISEESRAGVKWKECKPREGVRVTTILHDGSEVWKAKRGEKCLVANLLSDSKSTLVSIGIDSGVIPEYKYYAKNGTLWTPIQKDVYDGKSKTLKEALQSSKKVQGAVTDSLEAFKNSSTGNSPSDGDSTQLPSVPDNGIQGDTTETSPELVKSEATPAEDTPGEPPNGTSPEATLASQPDDPSGQPTTPQVDQDGKHGESTSPNVESVSTVALPPDAKLEDSPAVTVDGDNENDDLPPVTTQAPPALGAQGTPVQTTQSVAGTDQQTAQKSTVEATPDKPDEETTPATPAGKDGQPAATQVKTPVTQHVTQTGQSAGNPPTTATTGEPANQPVEVEPTTPTTPQAGAPQGTQPTNQVKQQGPQAPQQTPKAAPNNATAPAPQTHHVQPPKPFTDLTSKVDSSLFDSESGREGTIPTLKLTAKSGQSPKKVTFDNKVVWEAGTIRSRDPCSSAVLYFDGESPILAVIYKLNKGKEEPKYRYHDGKKWQDGNETTHKTKLDELKNKHPSNTRGMPPGGGNPTSQHA